MKRLPFYKTLVFSLAALLILGSGLFFLLEVALRYMPVKSAMVGYYRFDPVFGVGLYPGAKYFYKNRRGETVVRVVNRWGFLDADHRKEKPPGLFRIGFFGDSFTEAAQVPLNATFFRRIQDSLPGVESLAFGVSGYGTYQAYLLSRKWVPFFDIDLAVYVFVENDPGDNLPEVSEGQERPFPVLKGGRLVSDNSFAEKKGYKTSWWYRAGDYLCSRSLLLSTLKERMRLLSRYVLRPMRYREQGDEASTGGRIRAMDPPSKWPADLKSKAQKITEKVLCEWKSSMESLKVPLVVFYVPREKEYLKKKQDSWREWLISACRRCSVPMIDPTSEFAFQAMAGKELYYDHFTEDGHSIFSSVFVDWFLRR